MPAPWKSCRPAVWDGRTPKSASEPATFLASTTTGFPHCAAWYKNVLFHVLFQLISKQGTAFAKLPAIAWEREVTGQRQPATAIGSLW